MRLLACGLIVAVAGVSSSANAQEVAAKKRCRQVTQAQSRAQDAEYNNGLPALGVMMMAGGAALGGLALFGGTVGLLAVAERTSGIQETAVGLGAVTAVFNMLMVPATLVGVVGFGIWFVSWLPPVRSSLRPCEPE